MVIKGTPVSQGVATGPVRVAKRLTEANDTQVSLPLDPPPQVPYPPPFPFSLVRS